MNYLINKFKNVIISISSLLLSTSLYAHNPVNPISTFDYRVRIPATALSCEQEAINLGKRVSLINGLANVNASCVDVVDATFDKNQVQLYSLSVSYQNSEQLKIYTAALGGISDITSENSETAAYSTYNDCLNDISNQSNKFLNSTNLNVLAATCAPANEFLGGYVMSIDGAGTPSKTLKIFHQNFGNENEAINSDVVNYLISSGADLVRTVGSAKLYYSDNNVIASQQFFGMFQKEDNCRSQLNLVKSIYMGAKSKMNPLVYCVKDSTTVGNFELHGLSDVGHISNSELETKYFSFAECANDSKRIMAKANNRVLGYICNQSSDVEGEFVMNIYIKN